VIAIGRIVGISGVVFGENYCISRLEYARRFQCGFGIDTRKNSDAFHIFYEYLYFVFVCSVCGAVYSAVYVGKDEDIFSSIGDIFTFFSRY